jgi:hypothetical protein
MIATAPTTRAMPRGIVLPKSRLLGHVGDSFDAGVRHHRHWDRDQEVADLRGGAEVNLLDQQRGIEDQHRPYHHEPDLGQKVGDSEADVDPRGLLSPDDVDETKDQDDGDAGEDVGRRLLERLPEHAEVVRHSLKARRAKLAEPPASGYADPGVVRRRRGGRKDQGTQRWRGRLRDQAVRSR